MARWIAASTSAEAGLEIDGVILTDGELDHVAGLLSLRQSSRLRIWGTSSVRRLLEDSGLLHMLSTYTEIIWTDLPAAPTRLLDRHGDPSSFTVRSVPVGSGRPPRYAATGVPVPADASIALLITDQATQRTVGIAPSISAATTDLVDALGNADMALVDGTFCTENEMLEAGRGTSTASDYGHVPISSGLADSIAANGARVFLTHLNNTNPVLLPDSDQRRGLEARGLSLAHDGMQVIM